MTAAHEIRHERFHNARLGRNENKAVEMARNGFTRDEIAEEMDIRAESVSRLLYKARRKGVAVPRLPHVFRNPKAVPIEHLVRARARLRASGVRWGVCKVIAEQFGMQWRTVNVRLWQYDQKQKGPTP